MAILAEENQLRAATTSYLNKAIEWNPDHIHTLLHEKAERTHNKELLKKLTPILLVDKIRKYQKLIKLEKNQDELRKLLKEAINDINSHKHNEQDKDIATMKINEYCIELEKIYDNDKKQKTIEKYMELADFYYDNHLKEKSIKPYLISFELLVKAQKNEYNSTLSEKVNEKIIELKTNIDASKISENQQIAKQVAKSILSENEDKETKEIVFNLYEDIKNLKRKEEYRDEFYSTLLDILFSLNISIGKQIIQNLDSNLKIKEENKNIESFSSLLDDLKGHVNEIPKIHDMQLNNIRLLVEEPTAELKDTSLKINTTNNNIQSYINNAEKSFNILINQEKNELESIHQEINSTLSNISEQNLKSSEDRNETLHFLKNSEKRMLANIHKINMNIIHENETTSFIQQRIAQLENNTKEISTKQSANDFQKELAAIINTCQALEKNILELNDVHSYKDDINSIKKGQNRIEHTLIKKTVDALSTHMQNNEALTEIRHNQEKLEQALLNNTNDILTPDRNHQQITNKKIIANQRKKTLLIISFIIAMVISATVYFTVL